MSAELCLDDTDLFVAATLVTLCLSQNNERNEMQPLKTSAIFCVFCCDVHIAYGQTGAKLCFSVNQTAFPDRTSRWGMSANVESMFRPLRAFTNTTKGKNLTDIHTTGGSPKLCSVCVIDGIEINTVGIFLISWYTVTPPKPTSYLTSSTSALCQGLYHTSCTSVV